MKNIKKFESFNTESDREYIENILDEIRESDNVKISFSGDFSGYGYHKVTFNDKRLRISIFKDNTLTVLSNEGGVLFKTEVINRYKSYILNELSKIKKERERKEETEEILSESVENVNYYKPIIDYNDIPKEIIERWLYYYKKWCEDNNQKMEYNNIWKVLDNPNAIDHVFYYAKLWAEKNGEELVGEYLMNVN